MSGSVKHTDRACTVAKYWPQGYTVVAALASVVLSLRVWVVYQKSIRIGIALAVLLLASLAIEIVANLYVQGETFILIQ